MNKSERRKKRKQIDRIAKRLSDEGLETLLAAAELECEEDPDCDPGDPGSGEPPPDPEP